jgi:hypothetical protein
LQVLSGASTASIQECLDGQKKEELEKVVKLRVKVSLERCLLSFDLSVLREIEINNLLHFTFL